MRVSAIRTTVQPVRTNGAAMHGMVKSFERRTAAGYPAPNRRALVDYRRRRVKE
jgi:hypothetical protein